MLFNLSDMNARQKHFEIAKHQHLSKYDELACTNETTELVTCQKLIIICLLFFPAVPLQA